MADRDRISKRTTKIRGRNRTTIVEGVDSKHGSFYSRTDVRSSSSRKGRWGYIVQHPRLLFGGFTAMLFLVMIGTFAFSKVFGAEWTITFWKSYQSYTVNGWDPINHVVKPTAEIKTLYYFDVFGYLRNFGNVNPWLSKLIGGDQLWKDIVPQKWDIFNTLLFLCNLTLLPFYLLQFLIRFTMVVNLYTFAIFGFNNKFPLWKFCENLLGFYVPLISYLG